MVGVSVVVSTYSESKLKYVKDCIESLRKQSLLPNEVILVVDPRPSLVEFYRSRLRGQVKVLMSESFGLSNARNAGAKNSQGEIVAFIDDDARADVHWLKNLVRGYDNPKVVGVGGYVCPVWEGGSPAWFPAELNWIVGCSYKGLPERKASVRNAIGCNMSFRRRVFDDVGYFRTDVGRSGRILLDGEEPELSLRILKKFPESRIIYEPSAVVYHTVSKGRRKLSYMLKRSFYQGVSKAIISSSEKGRGKGLATESDYITYLFKVAIPSRLRQAYKMENLSHLMMLSLSTGAVFLGFSIGKLSART